MSKESELLKRLQQLKTAKERLRISNPGAVFDVDNEINKVNNALKQATGSNIISDQEEASDLPDEEAGHAEELPEPFGQDLNQIERQNQNRRATKEIIKNEPKKSEVPTDGPQAEASKDPTPPPTTRTERELPGGLARRLMRRGGGLDKKDAGSQEKTGAKGAAKQEAKQLAQQAIKNAIRKAAAQAVARLAAMNPITWVIIGIGLVLVIIAFIVGIAYMGTLNSKLPSTSGGTKLISVDPKKDTGTLLNFMKLTGETSVTDQAINNSLSSIKTNLMATKDLPEIKTNDAIVKQIDKTLGALAILEGNKSTGNSEIFLTELKKVYDITEGIIPVWNTQVAGPTVFPVKSITSSTVVVTNTALHGFSFLNNSQTDNHNVYTRSEDGKEQCDAVDVGVTAGEGVYPIFGGKIMDLSSDGDETGDSKKIIVKSFDGRYTALYAHIQAATKKQGDDITNADLLGIAKGNNIQIEIIYTENNESSCLVTNHADLIDHALSSRRHQDWGGYLWDRIVTTFNMK